MNLTTIIDILKKQKISRSINRLIVSGEAIIFNETREIENFIEGEMKLERQPLPEKSSFSLFVKSIEKDPNAVVKQQKAEN